MSEKTKLLYVDDEPINLMLFKINFEGKYEIITAENGFEGQKALDEHPDTAIIISDMKMPGMDGIDFIRKAKAKFPDKKFYILTGFEITDRIQEALDTNLIIAYFSKPFEIDKMHKMIAEALID